MLDIFENVNRDARINEQTYLRKETVLHLAAEEGLSSCVKRLINLGADLSAQDVDGNTVLHRLTKSTVLNPRHLGRHLEVFDIVFEKVVKWWCIKENIAYPDNDKRSDYFALQKKASLYLMNEVPNKDGLSVLAFSFNMGATDIISRLLMMPNVTMFEVADSGNGQYIFDVSLLTPLTNRLQASHKTNKDFPTEDGENLKKNKTPSNTLEKANLKDNKISPMEDGENLEKNKTHSKESGIEWLITQKVKHRSTQILDLPPIKVIEKYYTSVVRVTCALLLFIHIVYMAIFTYIGVDLLVKLRDDKSAIHSSDPETLLLYSIVPIEPLAIVGYCLFMLFSGEIGKKAKLIYKGGVSRSEIGRIAQLIRKGGVSGVLSGLLQHVLLLSIVIYAALVIAWIILFSNRYHFQDYILAPALCIGWLSSISLTRGFKITHYFYRMLVNMILKDFVRFTIIYLFVLLAFGFAFHVLFLISFDVVQNYTTVFDTLFLSFNMMIGTGELFDGTFESNMATAGRNVTYFKIFYLVYIILSAIIMVNLLIAMMNNSYSKILREHQDTWRIDSVILGVDITRRFPCFRRFASESIEQGQYGNFSIL